MIIIFERSRVDDVLICSPSIVSNMEYSDLVDSHRRWGADVTVVGTGIPQGADHPHCIYLDVGEKWHSRKNGRRSKAGQHTSIFQQADSPQRNTYASYGAGAGTGRI